ncbi:MAG: BolA family transcriptional regulator [FCB group bacterium]|nr:BolA family transcriptional regulator [FCB group bacterium]
MDMDSIHGMLEAAFPEADVKLVSTASMHQGHGSKGLHLRTEIIWSGFKGKSLIEQHQMVHAALKTELGNAIHAISILTKES